MKPRVSAVRTRLRAPDFTRVCTVCRMRPRSFSIAARVYPKAVAVVERYYQQLYLRYELRRVNTFMFDTDYTIIDDVLTEQDCKLLIEYYNTIPLKVEQGYNYTFKAIVSIFDRKPVDEFCKNQVSKILKYMPDDVMPQRAHIEHREHEHPAHFDDKAGAWGMFTTVLYLNDDFDGGKTFINLDTGRVEVEPKIGRLVAYNGHKLEHGVTDISNGVRYTLPIWYTVRPLDLPKSLMWWL